ncbi:thermonuclease family protein [Bradyrhizobium septentrionale]|uniref:thermonuclease family protein n=1 Tax=Bradyrhizobium septentrionale TaxID=1404411 RepID=UPI00159658E6|nr:thermonuclease family protein [Bradyrhizobium septentrionale]UGY28163.1 thermonuclease family protein [Bradyrhizobium septentrionale]
MKAISIAMLALLLSVSANAADDYLGRVTGVDDGDSFWMSVEKRRVHIRLCGIDSPERGEPGYGAAAGTLAALIEGKQIHCLQVGLETPCDGRSRPRNRDRVVAQCFIGHKDVAAEMVRLRQACDWPRFSAGHYLLDKDTCVREGN